MFKLATEALLTTSKKLKVFVSSTIATALYRLHRTIFQQCVKGVRKKNRQEIYKLIFNARQIDSVVADIEKESFILRYLNTCKSFKERHMRRHHQSIHALLI